MSEAAAVSTIARVSGFLYRARKYLAYAADFAGQRLPRISFLNPRIEEVTIGGLLVRCERSLPSDPAVLSAWESLYLRTPSATPFHSPVWQQALLETAQAMHRLRFLTVYDKSRLVAVLPLESHFGQVLRTSGAMLTDYLDPLIDPEYSQNGWPAILKGVSKLLPGRSVILEHLREDVCCCENLQLGAESAGFALSGSSNSSVARIALPNSWDAYLASLDSHERKELKRKMKKAEQQGGAKLVTCADPATMREELTKTFELFEACGGGKGRKAKWLFPRHFDAVAPSLAASGRLVLYKLMIEDRQAAAVITLPSHKGQILWNTASIPP